MYIMNKTIFTLFFLGLFLFSLTSCSGNKDITFLRMENVKVKSIDKSGKLKVTADAVLNNPRRLGAKVSYLECGVKVEGKDIAEVAQIKESKVPARSDFIVPLETEVSLKKVFGNSFSLAKGAVDGKVKVELDGKVKVKILGKTFTVPFVHKEQTPIF